MNTLTSRMVSYSAHDESMQFCGPVSQAVSDIAVPRPDGKWSVM